MLLDRSRAARLFHLKDGEAAPAHDSRIMMVDMVSSFHLDGLQIVALYDHWTTLWHRNPPDPATAERAGQDPDACIEGLHRANFELWHLEDEARDPHASDSMIAAAKRAIDRINQRRNDRMEQCDTLLLEALRRKDLPNPRAELHSETPGQMLDRLSILSLRRYHTLAEIDRSQPASGVSNAGENVQALAPPGHADRNRQRLEILDAQRADLTASLTRCWQRVLDGQLRFQVYRQLKMYNDPELNPILYRKL